MSSPLSLLQDTRFRRCRRFAVGFIIALAVLVPGSAAADEDSPSVVINEIHYKPDPATEFVEFVELHNPRAYPIDLSGWMLDGGVRYFFPPSAVLMPGAYWVVAQNADHFRAKYGFAPHGEFDGKLANEGEALVLRNWQSDPVDRIEYALGFPWPVVGPPPGHSIQLQNPTLDNAVPGAWRAAMPTPGEENAVFTRQAPPSIRRVDHVPAQPRTGEPVVVSTEVLDRDGVAEVILYYQVVAPGNYIALEDAAYQAEWTPVAMDQIEGEQWSVTLPGSLQQHRHLIRFRLAAVDGAGNHVSAPYADDPQPNFAYFVYDGIPIWQAAGSGDPGQQEPVNFAAMGPMAVYHMLAKETDVADAMFIPPSRRAEGYYGSDYLWTGTLVYDGIVYDHVGFRARGAWARFATGKTWWKINFLPAHRFQAHDNYGRPYAVKWDKLNLNGIMQHSSRGTRGEQGMYEATGFRLFDLAGVPSSQTHFVHLRVVDAADEQGATQFDGDFWGMYLAVENVDGRFLDEHDLPSGNLYKSKGRGELEKEHQGAMADLTDEDITGFLAAVKNGGLSNAWWQANVNIDAYARYLTVLDMIRHYDIRFDKNMYFFRDPDDGRWAVLPWDLDLTWIRDHAGIAHDALRVELKTREFFQIIHQNYLRELQDLLFNPQGMALLLDETAGFIDTPAAGISMVDADRFRWDYSPIFSTRYVDRERTTRGAFYRLAEDGTFQGMVDLMAVFVAERTAWSEQVFFSAARQPDTPALGYIGAEGYPADGLRFAASDYRSTAGGQPFAAMAWRVAEVTNPDGPVYDPAAPVLYEIDALYTHTSAEYRQEWQPPVGIAQPGHTYRVRVRMQDVTGRWSHWSAPIQFIAGEPAEPPAALVISEVHYHPAHAGPQDGDDFEFVELLNTGGDEIDLTNTRLAGAIEYRFAPGAAIDPGERVVVVGNRTAFEAFYGIRAHGEYDRRLGNGGDELQLLDGFGRELAAVHYRDEAPWPARADGEGPSLVLKAPDAAPSNALSWRASLTSGGSPGRAEPQPVVINEIALLPEFHVELHNPGTQPASIEGWILRAGDPNLHVYEVVTEHSIDPGGYLVLSMDELRARDGGPVRAPDLTRGGDLDLTAAEPQRLLDYRHGYRFHAPPVNTTLGRFVTTEGRDLLVAQREASLGAANSGPRSGPVIIDRIRFGRTLEHDSVRLTNISNAPIPLYDPQSPARTWRLDGLFYDLPPGLTLAAGESLLLSASSPVARCVDGATEDAVRLVGPLPQRLHTRGQRLSLLAPVAGGYTEIDRVDYGVTDPWPAAADGSLFRINSAGPGSEPDHWSSTPPAARGTQATLCAFQAALDRTADVLVVSWAVADESAAAFQIWGAPAPDRSEAVALGAQVDAQQAVSPAAEYRMVIRQWEEEMRYFWLDAVDQEGTVVTLGMTARERPHYAVYLPHIR